MKTFAKLAHFNVKHFNEHPAAHAALIATYAVGAAVAIRLMHYHLDEEAKLSVNL